MQGIKARRDWGKAMTFCSISWIHMDAASTGTGPLMWGIFHRCQELCSPVRAFTLPHPGLSCQGSSDSSMWAHIPHLPMSENWVHLCWNDTSVSILPISTRLQCHCQGRTIPLFTALGSCWGTSNVLTLQQYEHINVLLHHLQRKHPRPGKMLGR